MILTFPEELLGEKTILRPYDYDKRWSLRRCQLTDFEEMKYFGWFRGSVNWINESNRQIQTIMGESNIRADIFHKEKDILIGECALTNMSQNHFNSTFGIWIGKGYQNQGFGFDAAKHFIDFYRSLNLEIAYISDEKNIAGKKLAHKLGFSD